MSPQRHLVTLRESGPAALVFVHPASGTAAAFHRLPAGVGGGRSVLAFENPAPAGDAACSIGGVATGYARELAARGPSAVVLAGWSFGGPVALEMAAHLEAMALPVGGVVLIDAAPPAVLARIGRPLARELPGLFELSAEEERGIDPDATEDEVWTAVVTALRARHGQPALSRAELQPFADTYAWHVRALHAPWTPPQVDVPVALIRARDEPAWAGADPDLGWADALGTPVEVVEAPGTHYGILGAEHVDAFAGVLAGCLDRLA